MRMDCAWGGGNRTRFYEFIGGDNKSTIKHVGIFLAQIGECSTVKVMSVYYFPMS
jgi:hypothetical protein